MADRNGKTGTIPYAPYKTFVATLDSFANFLPHRIDASIWPSYSGGMRNQLLNTYKFLGLINDDGTPTADLKKLADEKENRGATLREVLKRSYVNLLKLDLSKATPSSLDEELRKYGVEGDTRRKATAFFLTAAKAAGIPLSPLLTARGGMATTRPKVNRPKPRIEGTGSQAETPKVTPPHSAGGPGKTITLESGITVTLSTSADLFSMTKADRQWVLGLLDMLDQYEEEHPQEVTDEENEAEEVEVA
jgi:hypothetical protein